MPFWRLLLLFSLSFSQIKALVVIRVHQRRVSHLYNASPDKNHKEAPASSPATAAPDAAPSSTTASKLILIISDSTGSMARSALRKILFQFDDPTAEGDDSDKEPVSSNTKHRNNNQLPLETKSFSFVQSEEAVAKILNQYAGEAVKKELRNSTSTASCITPQSASVPASVPQIMVLYTFANPALRSATTILCQQYPQVITASIDLLGNLFDQMGIFLQQTPAGWPTYRLEAATAEMPRRRRPRALSSNYFSRMEAVEFTLQADDGKSPWLWPAADVVLVGVSRTGKTPLSVVLSHTMGLKVANVPLVWEVPAPSLLLNHTHVDPRRIFLLTLAPHVLGQIRTARLERKLGQGSGDGATNTAPTPRYAERSYVMQDLVNARQLAQAHNWTEIDVTGRAVEETATQIVALLNERFPTMTWNP